MSKELEALSRIEDCLYEDPYTDRNDVSYENDIATIKQALLKAQELEKENSEYKRVLDIIKEKDVDIKHLKWCINNPKKLTTPLLNYNIDIERDNEELTKEEFELLKRWLNENGAR